MLCSTQAETVRLKNLTPDTKGLSLPNQDSEAPASGLDYSVHGNLSIRSYNTLFLL